MTITIQIKSNEKELKKKMGLFQRKHLPKATANAINEIGAKVVNAERAQIQKRLDRPTPFTIKSVDMPAKFRAKPNDLSALVFIKKIAQDYLKHVYQGGIERPAKSKIFAPVSSAGGERLNAYGNLIGLKAKRIDSRKDMFLNKNALWKREGDGGLKLIAVAKNFIKHRKLLDFFKIGFGVIKKNYDKELDKQIKKAIRR
tara:strand:- start:62 stop:661 length:600 start_codon:yes stop_codon:yes gene_type:complete